MSSDSSNSQSTGPKYGLAKVYTPEQGQRLIQMLPNDWLNRYQFAVQPARFSPGMYEIATSATDPQLHIEMMNWFRTEFARPRWRRN